MFKDYDPQHQFVSSFSFILKPQKNIQQKFYTFLKSLKQTDGECMSV